jgi:hypothetical protein
LRLRSVNELSSAITIPPIRRSPRFTFSAAGLNATSTSSSSPDVLMSTEPKWTWKAETP